jgi:hypothetical protein
MQDMILLRLVAGMLLCGVASCGDNQDPGGARALWDRIHELDYRTWERAPGYASRRPSDAPHSAAVEIFVSEVVSDALRADTTLTRWPVGSLIVKDGWDGGDLELVAVMLKREDGWYWAEYDAEGSAAYSGAPSLCIGCHSSGDDFVRAFAFASAR